MVLKNMSFIFVACAIAILGITTPHALADDSAAIKTEVVVEDAKDKVVVFDKKAAAIEKYKAELAAKAAKKTESIEAKTEETVAEIKDEISGETEATTETKPTRIIDEVAEIKKEAIDKEVEANVEYETVVTKVKEGTVENAEEVKAAIEKKVAEVNDETTGKEVKEAIRIEEETKAAEALKEKAEHLKPELPKAEYPK